MPYRTSVARSHFRHAHRPGSYSAVRTSGMHIDQAHLGLHQHTGCSRVRTGCSTPRWTIQYVSMPDGRFRANPPLPLVVWAICAALSAVAIHRGGHRGINEANFSQSGDDYKFFTKQKKKKRRRYRQFSLNCNQHRARRSHAT